MALRKRADPRDRAPRFRHERREGVPDMRHSGPNLERRVATRGAQAFCHPNRIVQQNLVAAHLNQGWGQSVQVAIERRSVWMARVRTGKIARRERREIIEVQYRIVIAPVGCAGHGQVGPGRKRNHGGGKGRALVARLQRQRQCEASPGRIAQERTALRIAAIGKKRAPRLEGIFERSRKGIFGCEPVIDDNKLAPARPGNAPRDVTIELRGAGRVAAAVQEQDPPAGQRLGNGHGYRGGATQSQRCCHHRLWRSRHPVFVGLHFLAPLGKRHIAFGAMLDEGARAEPDEFSLQAHQREPARSEMITLDGVMQSVIENTPEVRSLVPMSCCNTFAGFIFIRPWNREHADSGSRSRLAMSIVATVSPCRVPLGKNEVFYPPAPVPRERAPGLLALLPLLASNPLKVWCRAHFEQRIVHGGLPFLPAMVLNDPRDVQHVLLENVQNYRKDDLLLRILTPALRNGLLTVEGEQWRKQRHAVAPMFARKTIRDFAPAMNAAADALIGRWSSLPDGAVVEVAEEMTRVTLDVLERTIFSTGMGADTEAIRHAMRRYFDTIGRIDPLDALGLPGFLPRPTRWRARASLKFFDRVIDEILAKRRALAAERPQAVPRDILTLLLEARDPQSGQPLSDEELRANIITLIAAGHETTANALAWSLFLLSQSPVWKARVIEEGGSQGTACATDPCGHLKITRAVIDEALRLYPPIAAISRVAINEDEVSGQYIRAGTLVIVAPWLLHRHRMLWRQPDAFDPERFLSPGSEPVHRYAYLPFGAGARICLGAAFALQEATLVLAAVTRHFDLELPPGAKVEPMLRITLRPKDGLSMILRHRRGAAN